jgi:uncharacterized DUF497 family protein
LNANFEWDGRKEAENLDKHGISFREAQKAFLDPRRVVLAHDDHSHGEQRFFCLGKIDGHVVTVRFTMRGEIFRIFGAGYWRNGRRTYEKENKIH